MCNKKLKVHGMDWPNYYNRMCFLNKESWPIALSLTVNYNPKQINISLSILSHIVIATHNSNISYYTFS